jgi:hypothetical protein
MTENAKNNGMSERAKFLKARNDRVRELTPKRPMLQVEPTKDDYRKYLKHPNGTKFPQNSGSALWPQDRFTRRRIADGSVKVIEQSAQSSSRSPPQPRQHRGGAATETPTG